MAEVSHGLPHRCNGYRKFLALSQVHHFRGVERANKEKRGDFLDEVFFCKKFLGTFWLKFLC